MPNATSKRNRTPRPPSEDPQNELNQTEAALLDAEEQWRVECSETNLNFFDALNVLPEQLKDQCEIYLYRLEPRVVNQQGPSYIDKYGTDLREPQVKNEHGGGKYLAILRRQDRKPPEMANHKFRIDGLPKFKPGQTLRDTGEAVGPATPADRRGELAQVVQTVVDAQKTGGTDAAIEIMQKGFERVMDMQTKITAARAETATGSTMGDKLLETMLKRLDNPPAAPPAIDPMAMFKSVVELVKELQPKPPKAIEGEVVSPIESMTSQVSFLKELTGVESLSELFQRPNGSVPESPPWWAGLISSALEKAPEVLARFSQMQQEAFQRAILASQLAKEGKIALPAPATPGQAVPPLTHAPVDQVNPPAASTQEITSQIIATITRAFDGGWDGEVAAAHLELSFPPELIAGFIPYLTDEKQLQIFIASFPALAERAKLPKWARFQNEFVGSLLGREDEDEEEPDHDEPDEVEQPA